MGESEEESSEANEMSDKLSAQGQRYGKQSDDEVERNDADFYKGGDEDIGDLFAGV